MVLVGLAVVSGLAFLYYGIKVLFGSSGRREFERYGIPGLRPVVGLLEVLGGTAVLFGLGVAPLGVFAASGLTALMILGLVVRLRIHDAPRLMVPAALLAAVNAALVVLFLTQ